MKKSSCLIIAAAVATLSLSAQAQFQLNTGNAADANTRANSYGSNGPDNTRPVNSALVNGNQIVTGNVTGGRALQTSTGYYAPGQLETNTGTEAFQDFIRDSVGVPAPYQQSQPSYVAPQAFYAGTTTATPPSGFVRNTNTGAYVPVTPQSPQMGYDSRVGLLNPAGISPADAGLTPSQSIIPQTSFISGAQLYGADVTAAQEENASAPYNSTYRQWTQADKQQLSEAAIAEMRSQLDESQSPENSQNSANGNNQSAANIPPGVTPGSLSPQSLNPQPLTPQPGVAQPPGAQPNPSATALTQNSQSSLTNPTAQQPSAALMSPAQQSAQYAQLEARFKQFETSNAQPSPNDENAQGGNNAQGESPATPPQLNTPEQNARSRAELYPPSVPASPLLIHSLAVGIRAQGLRNVMADAEEHMRQGHYAEAMLRYAAANQVAPNNPLVPLGRAFAELGAGYYARADHDLRGALQADPVLLMGRYDLKNLLGDSRLEFVVHDLKQIAVSDKQNVDAPFLLAYIAYNTGSSSAAGEYLDLTEKRSTGNAPVIGLMRQYWGLSATKK